MTAETILTGLVRINLIGSVAILLVLLLRPWVTRRSGASITYWLWLVVPIAVALSILPAPEQVVTVSQPELSMAAPYRDELVADAPATTNGASDQLAPSPIVSWPAIANVLIAVWLLGACALFGRSIVCTLRLAADPSIGPALVGVFRPKLVLPEDFMTRFDAEERALILAHEQVHRVSGHIVVNALVEVVRCASWFNPLVHLAASRIRSDQELACDAAVIAARPTARRAYAQALLKTQASPASLTFCCSWTSQSAQRLSKRIAMLGRSPLSRRGAIAGVSTVAVVGLALGYAAWAQQPDRLVTQIATLPEAVWTPSSEAPDGVLSHSLEERRHDRFIERAQAGDIDFVFFGTTDTEMWSWQDRGRTVLDQAFGSLKAANFGSQGTQTESLLWRMQNGELDGYQAKLIVLQAGTHRGLVVIERYAALIAEVRARQPQARILLFAPFPRGQESVASWRQRAEANAATFAELVDDETVFYANIGERFFRPDGTFRREMWSLDLNNRGIQTAAFDVWAEELQPWLDRFVR